jgi:K+-transporting ATPase KdpF subunit
MTVFLWIAGLLAAGLAVYLLAAMLVPERFE